MNWLSSEQGILKRIIQDKQALSNAISFALDSAFPYPEHSFENNIYIAINVPRNRLRLSSNQKPGDIDLLIVPYNDAELLLSKVIAIEVKIVRATLNNPSRNANSMGKSQVNGLLQDGFPFVGLLHISIPESVPEELLIEIPFISNKISKNGELIYTGETAKVDLFPILHVQRHEGRLISLNLHEEIAYSVIEFSLTKDFNSFGGNTFGECRSGKKIQRYRKYY